MKNLKTFTCKGCKHTLPCEFQEKTEGYCYMCDPTVTVDELLIDFDNRQKAGKIPVNINNYSEEIPF